jgi:membrane dipeptidase
MSDEMLQALGRNGGVIQINYEITFLSQDARSAKQARGKSVELDDAELKRTCGDDEACEILEGERRDREAMVAGTLPRVGWEKIVEHIDHVVKLVGADHVGLGSDFDGASMPDGMEDVSRLPKITEALIKKGYTDDQIKGILGENLLKLMEKVEKSAGS